MTIPDQPFLAAVLANSDDDLPRLIYADWLDEIGQPARGEFIRVQCELARLDVDPPCPIPEHKPSDSYPGCGDWCRVAQPLWRRERELWHENAFYESLPGSHWVPSPDLWVSTSVARFDFRRGFVSRVACTWADWQQHGDAILAVCPIRGPNVGTEKKPEYRLPQDEQTKVVLTTWPEWVIPDFANDDRMRLRGRPTWHHIAYRPRTQGAAHAEIMADLLGAEWPGVRFKLPETEPGTLQARRVYTHFRFPTELTDVTTYQGVDGRIRRISDIPSDELQRIFSDDRSITFPSDP